MPSKVLRSQLITLPTLAGINEGAELKKQVLSPMEMRHNSVRMEVKLRKNTQKKPDKSGFFVTSTD